MTDQIHTPGPWVKGEIIKLDGSPRMCIDAAGFGAVALVSFADDDESDTFEDDLKESQSNASLIAASPELLASLKRMLQMHEMMMEKTNIGANFYDAETIAAMNEAPIQAKQVIAKAQQIN